MNEISLVFFDDYPLQSENVLFVERLKRSLNLWDIHIETPKTFHGIEECLRREDAVAVVLDIMAKVPQAVARADRVSSSLAGIEILRRCRAGSYGDLNKNVPIYMRTARGEPHVRRLAMQLGASGYYLVGTDDGQLIRSIRSVLEERG